jgi:hypothetical protein
VIAVGLVCGLVMCAIVGTGLGVLCVGSSRITSGFLFGCVGSFGEYGTNWSGCSPEGRGGGFFDTAGEGMTLRFLLEASGGDGGDEGRLRL